MLDLEKTIMKSQDRALRRQLVKLLGWQDAHLNFDAANSAWLVKSRGVKPAGAAHTARQLLEHVRIAPWESLEFRRNPGHLSPESRAATSAVLRRKVTQGDSCHPEPERRIRLSTP